VQVDRQANAGVAAIAPIFCSNEDQIVDLAGLLSGADSGGIWTETSSTSSQGGAFNPVAGTFRTVSQLPGAYSFEYLLLANGACPEDAAEVSVIISPVPVVTIANAIAFDCTHAEQTLDASGSSSGPGESIQWTGPGIIAGGNTLMPTINKPGTYELIIQNSVSGCVDSASIVVVANTDTPTEALVMSQDPSCFGDENGIISIQSVTGGTPPFTYGLNGGAQSTNDFYSDLPPGDYLVTIEDASGCRLDTLIQLDTPSEISIDVGPDIALDLGDVGSFQIVVNPATVGIDTILWTPANLVECMDMDCLEGLIHAFNTVTLTATLYDENGCSATDQLQVLVDKSRKIYIPNAISPNDDEVNDIFFISAKENQIARIKKFLIFSRWGEVIYEVADIQPNDLNAGWNGHYKDEEINPGVYVYMAEIEFFDGVEEVYTGDVTVIR
jgi:gliding motility-associated-like protein